MDKIPEEVSTAIPGVLGSLTSMLFIKGNAFRRVCMFLAGAALAVYATPWGVHASGLDAGFAGWLLGLLGMTIVSRAFESFETAEVALIFRDWLRLRFGLPPKKVE